MLSRRFRVFLPAILSPWTFLLFFPSEASAVAIVSAQSGGWSVPSTWAGGAVPASGDPVTIDSGHVVSVDATSAEAGATTVNGTLMFSRSADSVLALTGGDLTVASGGTLDLGTEASPIPEGIRAQLVLALGSSAGQYGLIIEDGGAFFVRGATKTPYGYALASIPVGGTSLQVASSDAVGWKAGDTITIGPTSGSGSGSTEERVIGSIAGTGPFTVTWSGGLANERVLSDTTPIIVADLTHNVLIRSAGTGIFADTAYIRNLSQDAAKFNAAYGEFAYIGSGIAHKSGIVFDGIATAGSLSSSTIRDGYEGIHVYGAGGAALVSNVFYKGYYGVYLESTGGGRLSGNVIHGTVANGVYLDNASNAVLTGNNIYSGGNRGLMVSFGSGNDVTDGRVFSNGGYGIFVWSSSGNLFARNHIYSNDSGIYLYQGTGNVLEGNAAYSQASSGFVLDDSSCNTVASNEAFSNGDHGISLMYGEANNNILAANRVGPDNRMGIDLEYGAGANTMVANDVYSNRGYGIYDFQSAGNLFADGRLGYDLQGSPASNGTVSGKEVGVDDAGAALVLRRAFVNPARGIDTSGLTGAGASLLSLNQDAETGTVRLWGDHAISGSTLTLDYARPLYVSTATAPRLMRGSGHSLTGVAVSDAASVSELLMVKHAGSNAWEVSGSSSGVLGTFVCAPSSTCGFSHPKAAFTLATGPSNGTGDRLDFAVLAASNDEDRRKRLLIGPAAPSFNAGKSRLTVEEDGGLTLRGADGEPTLMDRLDASATYYTFSCSGAFTLERSTVGNTDQDGLRFTGGAAVSLASSSFDWAGQGSGSTSTYVTLSNLTSRATFYGLAFDASRPSPILYNVRVAGADAGLGWRIADSTGALSGEDFDDDPNGRILWGPAPLTAGAPLLHGYALSSSTLRWEWTPGAGGAVVFYTLFASTGGTVAALPGSATYYLETSLAVKTTYQRYLEARNISGEAYSSTVTVATPFSYDAAAGVSSGTVRDPATNAPLIEIPAGAAAAPMRWLVSLRPREEPLLGGTPGMIAAADAAAPAGLTGSAAMMAEYLATSGEARYTGTFAQPLTVIVAYPDANEDGFVDGLLPLVPVSLLRLYTLNETAPAWEEVAGSWVDRTTKSIRAKVNHLSVFAAFGTAASLSTAKVYPNPWRPGSGGTHDAPGIAFDNMTLDATIRIYTVTGDLVVRLVKTAADGAAKRWDGKNSFGEKVASGVYIYRVTNPAGETMTGRLAIIR